MQSQKTSEDVVCLDAKGAKDLLLSGHRYLDVRMKEDFEEEHVEGALNIQYYSSVTPEGRVKNPQFIEEVSAVFDKDEQFIVGCRTGNRSVRAAVDLLNAGFKNVKNMGGGYVVYVAGQNASPVAEKKDTNV